ncbi:MAG: coproporphyrinogen III oxidase family protein [Actinobacteria bacterium]|nr:coproporphyrinogen III oxidase family protein [Actinomycetota bacterium]
MKRSLLASLGPLDPTPIRHAYVHVPFCASICPFCSFHVAVRERGAVERFLVDLDAELAEVAEHCEVELDTLYLGGGTPTFLRSDELERLTAMVTARLGWPKLEATIEIHPSTATAERVRRWVELGFNRLSVGAQSFDDGILEALGRTHSAADTLDIIDACLATGAVTSLDLMMPSPGQDVAADVARAIATGVPHVSVYALTIEPGTPFAIAGRVVADGDAAEAIEGAAGLLAAAGYERYEVSNYARPGARCLHDQAYWNARPCLGVGPSASGLVRLGDGTHARYSNPRLGEWMAPRGPLSIAVAGPGADAVAGAGAGGGDPDDGGDASEAGGGEVDLMTGEALMGDLLLCGLRLVEGVDLETVAERGGVDPRLVRGGELKRLESDGLVEVRGSLLRATDHGRMLLDGVASALM